VYEVFEHTADIGIRVLAPDLDTLFREAAEALVALVVEDPPDEGELRDFALEGQRLDWLLFDWLSEILYVVDAERLVPGGFEVELCGTRLAARARVQPLDPAGGRLAHEVKAVTYHGLVVEEHARGWRAEFIVDV
jgi:SHS2 domain-containing protein